MWPLLFLILLIPLAAIVLDSQLGRALASRLEVKGKTRRGGALPKSTETRISSLEGEIERLASEVRELHDQNDFLTELLAGSSDATRLPKRGVRGER